MVNPNIVNFEITGNGFLYNMVRIIIGTIQNVAAGKYEADYIKEILEKKNANSQGLKLMQQDCILKKWFMMMIK